MNSFFSPVIATALLITLSGLQTEAQGPQDFEVRVRLRREQALREIQQKELKEATKELADLTKMLVKQVTLADGYTTDAKILEYSDQIQELANEIEDLAKTIDRRARGR